MGRSAEQDIAAIERIAAVPTILQVVAQSTGMRFTVIARVTKTSWTACAVHDSMSFGLKVGDSLDVATTLCREVRDCLAPVVIEHANEEPEYCGHPTPKMYGFQSYIAVPILRRAGKYFGNLCALDPKPARLRDSKTLSMMRLFAELVGAQLDAEETHAARETALREAEQTAELREQFIAVLGHDLRTPLSSISLGADLLGRQNLSDSDQPIVHRIKRSARRIELLVDDVLDLTRGRLGGGLVLAVSEVADLELRLRHVVDELASNHPGRTIRFTVDGCGTVVCDRQRIEQVLSNLLGNALDHSDGEHPVDVRVVGADSSVVLSVHNRGTPIPADVLPRLFQPFYRAAEGERGNGLGLGLFIVAEIAKSHRGTVVANSSADGGTTFTFTLPRTPQ